MKSENLNDSLSSSKKTNINKPNTVTISKKDNAVLLKGVEPGVKIDVYTTSGAIVKSMVPNRDVVKIKLPAKQIYILNVGKTRHKVTM